MPFLFLRYVRCAPSCMPFSPSTALVPARALDLLAPCPLCPWLYDLPAHLPPQSPPRFLGFMRHAWRTAGCMPARHLLPKFPLIPLSCCPMPIVLPAVCRARHLPPPVPVTGHAFRHLVLGPVYCQAYVSCSQADVRSWSRSTASVTAHTFGLHGPPPVCSQLYAMIIISFVP
jgi:hypothetical protein